MALTGDQPNRKHEIAAHWASQWTPGTFDMVADAIEAEAERLHESGLPHSDHEQTKNIVSDYRDAAHGLRLALMQSITSVDRSGNPRNFDFGLNIDEIKQLNTMQINELYELIAAEGRDEYGLSPVDLKVFNPGRIQGRAIDVDVGQLVAAGGRPDGPVLTV